MAIFHSYFSHYQRGILFHRLVIAMMVRHHSYVSQTLEIPTKNGNFPVRKLLVITRPGKSHSKSPAKPPYFPMVSLWFALVFHSYFTKVWWFPSLSTGGLGTRSPKPEELTADADEPVGGQRAFLEGQRVEIAIWV